MNNKPIPIQDFEREQRNAPRIKLIPFADIKLDLRSQDLIKGIISRAALLVVWGPPKSGKSFWMFDASMHISLGRDYRGRRVKQGTIIYLYLEGHQSFGKRKEAFLQHHPGIDPKDVPFYLVVVPIDLIRDQNELIAAIEQQSDGPAMVVIDTLNRSLAGSESDDRDMGDYIKAADAIRAKFGCSVAIVHHCGIAGDRPRGHTSLTGACDAQLAVKKVGDITQVTVELLKDGAAGDILHSRLEPIEVGIDEDGDAITSCVIVPVEGDVSKAQPTRKLSDRQKLALEALADLSIDGEPPLATYGLPEGIKTVQIDLWRDSLLSRGVLDREGSNPRADFKRLKESLMARHLIGERDGRVWSVN